MTRLGDRRGRVRLEVVGSLWATLELSEPAHVVNISREGALIASPVAMAPDSVQPLHLNIDGRHVSVEARVRHVRRVSTSNHRPQYLVGVEFLTFPAALAASLEV